MTTWFVSRHGGALQWMQQYGPAFDCHVLHLNPAQVQRGDTVIGTLPVHLAAQVCARGAAYWRLALALPAEARGRELGLQELQALGARRADAAGYCPQGGATPHGAASAVLVSA